MIRDTATVQHEMPNESISNF